jgi:hypothetical protein
MRKYITVVTRETGTLIRNLTCFGELPTVGEQVEFENDETKEKYVAVVVAVDKAHKTYDAEVTGKLEGK